MLSLFMMKDLFDLALAFVVACFVIVGIAWFAHAVCH
jgi:hypothetical protein